MEYTEKDSSDSEHDAYLERMKAEGDTLDSEDGILYSALYHALHTQIVYGTTCVLLLLLLLCVCSSEDSDFVAKASGSEDDLE